MTDWEALAAAGHDFTFVSSPTAVGTYYCENCGALLLVRHEGIEVFHVRRGSLSTPEHCAACFSVPIHKTLKSKLEEMRQRDYERLKEI